MPARRTAAVLLTSLAALALTACGSGPDPLEADPVPTDQVSVVDNAFEPISIEVPVGEPVTWTWEGRQRHDVVGQGPSPELATELQVEGTHTATFDEPGTIEYRCTIHRGMVGVVHVVEG